MPWDLEQERMKAFQFVEKSYEQEKQGLKKLKLQQTINIAKDEISEINQEFQSFLHKVEHLVVFQELFSEPIKALMQQMLESSCYFLEKNYSKDEINEMPDDVYRQVAASQERRKEVLKKLALKYQL